MYLADIKNKIIYNISKEVFFKILPNYFNSEVCICNKTYYIDKLIEKNYTVVAEQTSQQSKGLFDSELAVEFDNLNDYIFEEYAHEYSDLYYFIKNLFEHSKLNVEYRYDSGLGVPVYSFSDKETFDRLYELVLRLED